MLTVPFRRDPDFVDRGDLLTRIDERCSQPAGRVALVGLGGAGKSQLAIEYAHRVRDLSPDTWVFWVFASNVAQIETAYKNIADKLLLPGRNESTANVIRLVTRWLTDESTARWVIIVDNLDSLETLHAEVRKVEETVSIARMVPESKNGGVIITSRNIDVVREMVGRESDILRVGQMSEEEAAQLLRRNLARQPEGGEVELLKVLDYFPLAITQAAAYLHRQPRMSVSGYLTRLQAIESKAQLLGRKFADARRYEKAESSILKTWQMSFEQIKAERPSAADLLSFMSFFNQQGIPKFMLHYYQGGSAGDEMREGGKSIQLDEGELEEDVATLYGFSLISATTKDDEYEMHGLVQFAVRTWLKLVTAEEWWWGRFVLAMGTAFPKGEYENWSTCRTLLPHIESIAERVPSSGEQSEAWVQVLTNAGWYSWKQGLLSQAERLLKMSLKRCEEVFGREDQRTLLRVSILASVLQYQGKYEAAEAMNRRALEGRERELGKDHPDTLTSMSNLASVLQYQGKYEAAEAMNRRALEGRERELGEDHPFTLTSVNNLAGLLWDLGMLEEASQFYIRGINGFTKVLGEHHPTTMQCQEAFAVLQEEMVAQ